MNMIIKDKNNKQIKIGDKVRVRIERIEFDDFEGEIKEGSAGGELDLGMVIEAPEGFVDIEDILADKESLKDGKKTEVRSFNIEIL